MYSVFLEYQALTFVSCCVDFESGTDFGRYIGTDLANAPANWIFRIRRLPLPDPER